MSSTRRAPHCKTCHKPLKGHKRGVCATTDSPIPETPPPPSATRRKSTPRNIAKSAVPTSPTPPPPHSTSSKKSKLSPRPITALPTLSPQSSQILNNILRTNSHNAPPKQARTASRKYKMPGTFINETDTTESLHEVLERLSASDAGEKKYTPTEVDENDAEDGDGSTPPTPIRASLLSHPRPVSQLEEHRHADTFLSTSNIKPSDMTIQNFLDSISQNSYHPPATIFSFPISAIPSLKEDACSLGLFVHVLSLSESQDQDEWVPVVVGRDEGAIAKLLEDSEKLAQTVRQSGTSKARSLGIDISHVVVGSLGALATWAGLAYS